MDSIPVTWFCAFCLAIPFISCFHEVYGRSSLPFEDISGPKELRSLKYTHMKTLKTHYGDIYDCVELYKQPAFQHPLLRNHKIQMRPTSSQQRQVSEKGSPSNIRSYGLKKECPQGTVPIRRTTKDEQFQAKALFRQHFQGTKFSNGQTNWFAGVSSTVPPHKRKFNQAEGYLSTHNPVVDKGQLSASVISIESGTPDDGNFGTIRVGWMVYPDLYKGDNRTRLYTSWGQFQNSSAKGCFNTYCPGFVQVNKKIPLDMVIDKISVPAAQYSYIKLGLIRKDAWWLTYGEDDESIGYWPNELFTSLQDGADVINLGGWVSSLTTKVPMMGSGLLGSIGSIVRRVVAINGFSRDDSLNGTANNGALFEIQVMQSQCYKAGLNNYKGDYWGDSFWYGGNGGDVQQCPV